MSDPVPVPIIDATKFRKGSLINYRIQSPCSAVKLSPEFRTVYPSLPELVVVKHLRAGRVSKRELEIHARLDHPNIVTLLATVTTPVATHLVLESCEEPTLFEWVNTRGHLSEVEARFIMLQLIDAVLYLHSHNICHRDIKPENVFLHNSQANGLRAKLGDFGLSTVFTAARPCSFSMVGTPGYVAPEVLTARATKRGYDTAADVWSLGVVLFIMVIGGNPIDARIMKAHIESNDVKFVRFDHTRRFRKCLHSHSRRLSTGVKSLISAMLQPDPAYRPTLTQVLQHAFFCGPWTTIPRRLGRDCLRRPPDEQTTFQVQHAALKICALSMQTPRPLRARNPRLSSKHAREDNAESKSDAVLTVATNCMDWNHESDGGSGSDGCSDSGSARESDSDGCSDGGSGSDSDNSHPDEPKITPVMF